MKKAVKPRNKVVKPLNMSATSTKVGAVVPNPGTKDAIDAGCLCPTDDNNGGRGAYYDGKAFWYSATCPMHGYLLGQAVAVRIRRKSGANIASHDVKVTAYAVKNTARRLRNE